jgi:hypothetical protein
MMKEKVIVTDVYEDEKMFHIGTENALSFGLEKRFLGNAVPKFGDRITLYLRNLNKIVGVDINDKTIYRLTKEQEQAIELEQEAERLEKSRQRFEKTEGALNQMFEELPRLLQARIEMFRKYVENFRVEHEEYELSVIVLGYLIYRECKAGNIDDFSDNVDRFNIGECIRCNNYLKAISMNRNQILFAQSVATVLFRDTVEQKINMSSPTAEDLKKSLVMLMPNALASITSAFCWPREEYINRYIESLN